MKVQKFHDLIAEMKAVARGEKPAPADAAEPSFETAAAVMRLLTRENRTLLRIIRDDKPQSIAELARLSGRAEPNVLRTLGKLEAVGLIAIEAVANRRVPTPRVGKMRFEIDPYDMADRVELTPA